MSRGPILTTLCTLKDTGKGDVVLGPENVGAVDIFNVKSQH